MFRKYFSSLYIFSAFFALFLLAMSSFYELALGKNFFYLYYIILLPLIDRALNELKKDFFWWDINRMKTWFIALLWSVTILIVWYLFAFSPLSIFFVSSFFFFWYLKIDTRIYFVGSMFCLLSVTCFLLMKNQATADQYALYLYISLVCWVLLSILSPDTNDKNYVA